jgi:hypothetical protein
MASKKQQEFERELAKRIKVAVSEFLGQPLNNHLVEKMKAAVTMEVIGLIDTVSDEERDMIQFSVYFKQHVPIIMPANFYTCLRYAGVWCPVSVANEWYAPELKGTFTWHQETKESIAHARFQPD